MGLPDGKVGRVRFAVEGAAAGGEDDPGRVAGPGALEHAEGAQDVHIGVEDRPSDRHPYVGLGGQVEDDLRSTAGDHLDQLAGADVELVEGELVGPIGPGRGQVGQRPARQVVDHVDGMALGQEPVDQVRADEPGTAGHQRPHTGVLMPASLAASSRPSTTRNSSRRVGRRGQDRPPSTTDRAETTQRGPPPRAGPRTEPVTGGPSVAPVHRAGAPSPPPTAPFSTTLPAPMHWRSPGAGGDRGPVGRRGGGSTSPSTWADRASRRPSISARRPAPAAAGRVPSSRSAWARR